MSDDPLEVTEEDITDTTPPWPGGHQEDWPKEVDVHTRLAAKPGFQKDVLAKLKR